MLYSFPNLLKQKTMFFSFEKNWLFGSVVFDFPNVLLSSKRNKNTFFLLCHKNQGKKFEQTKCSGFPKITKRTWTQRSTKFSARKTLRISPIRFFFQSSEQRVWKKSTLYYTSYRANKPKELTNIEFWWIPETLFPKITDWVLFKGSMWQFYIKLAYFVK